MPFSSAASLLAATKLLQDSAYSYRVWITLIKLLYAPLQRPKTNPDIHQGERLCARLLPSVPLVSEKNSSRRLGEPSAKGDDLRSGLGLPCRRGGPARVNIESLRDLVNQYMMQMYYFYALYYFLCA